MAKNPSNRVGVVGSFESTLDIQANVIYSILDTAFAHVSNYEIVTNGVDAGMLYYVHRWAWRRRVPVIGITCHEVWKYPIWLCNKFIVKGKHWGDEDVEFVNSIAGLIMLVEASRKAELAKQQGKQILDFSSTMPIT